MARVHLVGRPGRPAHTHADLPLDPLPAVLHIVAVPHTDDPVENRDPYATEVYDLREHPAGGTAYVFRAITTRAGDA